MERRTVLAAVAAAASGGAAGCVDRFRSGNGDGEDPAYHFELTVQNDHDQRHRVAVELVTDDSLVFDRSFAVEPGEGRAFGDDFPAGEYVLTVDVEGRSSLRSYWNTDHCEVHLVRVELGTDGHVSQHVTCRDSEEGPGPFGSAGGG